MLVEKISVSEPSISKPSVSKEGERKLASPLRSLNIIFGLGAGFSMLVGFYLFWTMLAYGFNLIAMVETLFCFLSAGALLWCTRLLTDRIQLAFQVYASIVVASLGYGLIMRLVTAQQLLRSADLVKFIIPSLVLFVMHRLIKDGTPA